MRKVTTTPLSLIAGIFAVTLLLSGCATTQLDVSQAPEEPQQAHLSGFTIRTSSASADGGSVSTAVRALQNSNLRDFGSSAVDALTEFLSGHGYELFTDTDMAERAETGMEMEGDLAELGYWRHPDTSAQVSTAFTGPSISFDPESYIQKVKGDSNVSYFVFSELTVSRNYAFLGFLGGKPSVLFNVAVVNAQGEPVIEAQAIGEGESQFFGIDFSQENLQRALDAAIANLNQLEEG